MSPISQPERSTQNCVIPLFRDELGYRYLDDWTHRNGNSNMEEIYSKVYTFIRQYTL